MGREAVRERREGEEGEGGRGERAVGEGEGMHTTDLCSQGQRTILNIYWLFHDTMLMKNSQSNSVVESE